MNCVELKGELKLTTYRMRCLEEVHARHERQLEALVQYLRTALDHDSSVSVYRHFNFASASLGFQECFM